MHASRTLPRRRLTPAVMLSLLAHALLLALVILWARHPVEEPESAPSSFAVIFEGGHAENPTVAAPEPRPKQAPAEPAPPAPALEPAEPPPAPRVSTPIEPLPPPPAPAIEPAPAPAPPIPRPHPPPRPVFPAPMAFSLGGPAAPPSVRRPAGRGIDLSFGRGLFGAEDTKVFGRADSREVGPDWFNEFAAWWDRHSYYPPQAGRNNEQGEVVLDLVVLRSGQVERVALASGSGSQWLDMGALGVFRGANLPPLPSDAAPAVPIHLTIHYEIVRR